RRADELAMLVSISATLRVATTTGEVMPIILREACSVTAAIVGTIYLVDTEPAELVLRGAYPPDEALNGLRQPLLTGIAGYVARTGETYAAHDLQTDPLVSLAAPAEAAFLGAVRSSLTVPLRSHEGIVGVLHVGRNDRHDFDPDEIHLLTAIAEIAGSA